MAGGEGTRLRPLTLTRPKPLVPIANQPLMEHILTLLKRHGIIEVIATVRYLAEEIESYFGDGSDYDVQLAYSIEDVPLGTAGSVKAAEKLLQDGTFLIVSGDAVTDCDLSAAVAFHREKKALATLVLCRVASPLEFGIVTTEADSRIAKFTEKPAWSQVYTDTVNTGIYVLEPSIFEHIEPGRNVDWSGDVFPKLVEAGLPIYGYVMEGYWSDVGTLAQYAESQADVLAGRVNLPLETPEAEPGIFISPGATVDPAAELVPPVVIGRNTKVRAHARVGPNTVIGDQGFIEQGALVENSTLFSSVYIGPGVALRSATVGERVTIKRDSVVQDEVVIGDRCLIDVDCTLKPKIKLWPDKTVERGSTVTMSLIWANKWRGTLFRDLGVAGLSNIELTPDYACRLASAFGSQFPARSRVVVSRDSTRSSRMLKRAAIAGLLSVGCDVLDLQGCALPVARHFIRQHEAAGAVSLRKLPGNSRVSLIEMFDSRGVYIPEKLERKVEATFFREDFTRTDPDDIGMIEVASHALDEYRAAFDRHLAFSVGPMPVRVVCDYGYSSHGSYYPAMLSRVGIESISLNGFNDAKLAPRSPDQIEIHVAKLARTVQSLGYEMGVLFRDEGERFALVDSTGHDLSGNDLLATFAMLTAKQKPGATIVISVVAPSALEAALKAAGANVIRAKAGPAALMNAACEAKADLAGDDRGGFIFPELHAGFDAMFGFARLVALLRGSQKSLPEIRAGLPPFYMAYDQARCPWEAKGTVMRRLAEDKPSGAEIELLDGIKVVNGSEWVLVLPDTVEPMFHVYAESGTESASKAAVREYMRKIDEIQRSGLPSAPV